MPEASKKAAPQFANAVPEPGRYDTLLLDLDGTLVDTAPDLAWSLNRLLEEAGRPPLDAGQVTRMVGDGAAKLVERGFAATGAPVGGDLDRWLRRFLDIYGGHVAVESRPYAGVEEVLDALKARGWRLAVCTNKPQAPSEALLRATGLAGFIDEIVGGDRVLRKKPDRAHLLAALQRLGVQSDTAVMVGDNRNDVEAAKAAGIPVIAVTYGYTREAPDALGATRLVDSFGDVPGVLAELAAHRSG